MAIGPVAQERFTTAALDDLDAAMDAASQILFPGLPGATKAEALEAVLAMGNKFEALRAQVLTSFEVTAEHRREGHGSVVAWAKSHQRVSGRDVARYRRTAHRLRDLPRAETALRSGLITVDHVDVLHRAYRLLGPSRFRFVEEALVDAAVDLRFVDFTQTVDYVIVRAAPDDADERARQDAEERYASSSAFGGGNGKVDAQFDPLGFQVWQAELDRLMDHLLESDRAEARDRLGRAPLASELRRSTRQRRVDAMRLMARRSSLLKGDDLGACPFVTNVHVSPEFLTALIAVLTQALNAADDPTFDLDDALAGIQLTEDSLHELDDGTVVTVNTVVLALLTGTVRGILYDPEGEVLRYGRGRRLFSPAQARLIRAMFRRCCHPWGCDRTGPSTQSDHTVEHQDGGFTDMVNGKRYCDAHNIWKTNHRWEPPPGGAPPPDRSQRRTPRRAA